MRVDDGAELATVSVSTNFMSLRRGVDRLHWTIARRLMDLIESQAPSSPPIATTAVSATRARPSHAAARVGPATFARTAARLATGKVRDKLTHDHWFIAFAFDTDPRALTAADISKWPRLVPPGDRLWDDPFLVQRDDRTWLFFEELVYREGRGVIAVREIFRDGSAGEIQRILERPYHLSYPCVFQWEGDDYMVPESGANRTVDLYRCVSFPWQWEPVAHLLYDVEAADPTIFEAGGRWWMYTSVSRAGGIADELHLHHAPSPFGPWEPHARNPLLNDITAGRCGGAPFVIGGRLVRAAQDGTGGYGHAIRLREIVALSAKEWSEVELGVILPDWAPRLAGTHTLNHAGGVTSVDAYRWRLRW